MALIDKIDIIPAWSARQSRDEVPEDLFIWLVDWSTNGDVAQSQPLSVEEAKAFALKILDACDGGPF